MRAVMSEKRGELAAVGASLAVVIMTVAGVAQDNPGHLAPGEVVRAFLALALISIAVPLALFRLGGLGRWIAYAFPVMLFLFFNFSHFIALVAFIGLRGAAAKIATLALLLAICAALPIPFRRRNATMLASFTFVVTASAGAASLVSGLASMAAPDARVASIIEEMTWPVAIPASESLPDIIYIVPDRYGSSATLEKAFDYDNSAFYAALRARGFHVKENARANYSKTFQSLPSTLNMTMLDPLFEAMGEDATSRRPLFDMIADNAAQKILRDAGYSFVHLGSWWQPTRRNASADVEFYGLDDGFFSLSEFERAVIRRTPAPWYSTIGAYVDANECDRLKGQLDYLETVREQSDRPVYAFVHLTMPHDPVTMDESGNCIPHLTYPAENTTWDDFRSAFRGHLVFLNNRLLEIFDANAAKDGGRGLVFVIQADEGPYPRRMREDGDVDQFTYDADELQSKFGIINAIYWNESRYGPPTLTETPINNWRLIFSKVLGADTPLIENERSVAFRNEKRPYETRDVTARLRRGGEDMRELAAVGD